MRLKNCKVLRNGINYKQFVKRYKENDAFAEVVNYVIRYKLFTFGVTWEEVGCLLAYDIDDVKRICEGKAELEFGSSALFACALNHYRHIPFLNVYLCDETAQFLTDVSICRVRR